jgi:uncharacterized RDD family membrane protein YckC
MKYCDLINVLLAAEALMKNSTCALLGHRHILKHMLVSITAMVKVLLETRVKSFMVTRGQKGESLRST